MLLPGILGIMAPPEVAPDPPSPSASPVTDGDSLGRVV